MSSYKGNLQQEKDDSHTIVADNDYLNDLGLSVFTTGTLYDWFFTTNYGIDRKDFEEIEELYDRFNLPGQQEQAENFLKSRLSKYKNLSYFEHSFSSVFGYDNGAGWPGDQFLINSADYYYNSASFWITAGRNGIYEDKPITDWANSYNGSDYTFNDLIIEDFIGKTYDFKLNPIDLDHSIIDNPNRDMVSHIIEMNNYVNIVNQTISEEDQDRTQIARKLFIRDLKASKNRCLEWNKQISFIFNPPNTPAEDCTITEEVNFKLFLYDFTKNKKRSDRIVIPKENIIAAPKTTGYGRVYNQRTDDGMVGNSINETPSNKTVGELDLTYNELEGKFESGSTQIVAIIAEDIDPADKAPTIDEIEQEDLSYLLSTDTGLKITTGKAYPLNMYDGNRLRWSPDYKSTGTCVKTKEKASVVVTNIFNRRWLRGEKVLLQKINGAWIPSPIPADDEQSRVDPANPQWEFMYLMTNSTYFFRNHAWAKVSTFYPEDTKITQDQYEKSFYSWYYKDDPNNNNLYPSGEFKDYADVLNGYFQVTSWDFMGVNIGGTRRGRIEYQELNEDQAVGEYYVAGAGNGNALSTTHFSQGAGGENFEDPHQYNSYPFFGCVFNEGYAAQNEYFELKQDDKNFFIAGKNASGLPAPFFYPSTKNPFENINDVKNIITTHQEKGIFRDGETGTLKHLPADIATNSDPYGIYGRPISSIQLIGDLNNNLPNLSGNLANYFKNDEFGQPVRYSWMYKRSLDLLGQEEYRQTDYKNSVFDFKPNDASKIEFRPLSAEVYACFEGVGIDLDYRPVDKWDYDMLPEYGFLASKSFEMTNAGKIPVISTVAVARNKHIHLKGLGITYFDDLPLYGSITNNFNGLKYGPVWLSKQIHNLPINDIDQIPAFWWDNDWYTIGTAASTGGIGIIGAAATFSTIDQIQFITDNVLGLDDYLDEPAGLLQGASYSPSFKNGDYSSLNSTALYARVYQHWPRDLTLYDPRFFVVHHFNYGVENQNDDITVTWYNDGEEIVEPITQTQDYPNGIYSVDNKESEVDFRVPTALDKNLVTEGTVYSNTVFVTSGESKLREKKDWNIKKDRRGKLLPYKYKFHTIGINEGATSYTIENDEQINDLTHDILIANPGSGYSEEDTFTVSGSEGGGVILTPRIDGNGAIVGFVVKNQGLRFDPSDFVDSTQAISMTNDRVRPTPKTRIVEGDKKSNGSGFVGYILRGEIYETELTDKKPLEALTETGPIKISADKPRSQDNILQTQVVETRNQIFSINPLAASPDSQYDIFLHYHNDITQNRVSNPNEPPIHVEQTIKLQILTNNSASALSQQSQINVEENVLANENLYSLANLSYVDRIIQQNNISPDTPLGGLLHAASSLGGALSSSAFN